MYTESFQIGPYTPAAQAEQLGKGQGATVAVQDGENFAWFAGSVFSAHSYRVEAPAAPALDRHPGDFTISNKQIFMFSNGAYEMVAGAYVLLFGFAFPQPPLAYNLTEYKWSYAYVGTKHFFSHPTVGELIWYDEFLDQWGSFRDACWTGPIYGICNADNRLVLQLVDVVSWSDFDDGLSFSPDFYKGTGCQSLGLIRYGQPYGVKPYRNGWLSFTSQGIMVSRPDYSSGPDPTMGEAGGGAGQVIFNHDELTFDQLPIGPCAIEAVEDKLVIWLTATGFHRFAPASGSNSYGQIEPWEPAMGAFYRDTILPNILVPNYQKDAICISYSREIEWLFVSSDASGQGLSYSRAHVWQGPMQVWGSFDHEHLHIGFGHGDADHVAPNYGFIGPTSEYCIVDHVPRNFRSWVKLSPLRIPMRPDYSGSLPAMISVQGLRLGVSKPAAAPVYKAGLTSSWFADKKQAERPTRCDVLVSGGDDANVATVDEQEYAHLVARSDTVIEYSCHVTGSDVTVFIIAETEGFYFDIHHIEATFFFAGLK